MRLFQVEKCEMETGGMDWSQGGGQRQVDYVHSSLSQEFMEELKEKGTGELLRLEHELKS